MSWVVTALRTVLTWVVGVFTTIVCATALLVAASINDTSPVIEKIIFFWSRSWLVASGTSLEVIGQENIDPERSYVVVANHLSTLDIMVCFLATRLPIRYLAKKELFYIPLLAQGMRAIGIVEVDRQARTAIHAQVNQQARRLISKRRSLIIFPEGTRPRDGVMQPFKKGAFTMALGSELPILPLSLHGTYQAAPSGKPWFHGGSVTAKIDPAIETEGLRHPDISALRDQVREVIAANVAEMGGQVA